MVISNIFGMQNIEYATYNQRFDQILIGPLLNVAGQNSPLKTNATVLFICNHLIMFSNAFRRVEPPCY